MKPIFLMTIIGLFLFWIVNQYDTKTTKTSTPSISSEQRFQQLQQFKLVQPLKDILPQEYDQLKQIAGQGLNYHDLNQEISTHLNQIYYSRLTQHYLSDKTLLMWAETQLFHLRELHQAQQCHLIHQQSTDPQQWQRIFSYELQQRNQQTFRQLFYSDQSIRSRYLKDQTTLAWNQLHKNIQLEFGDDLFIPSSLYYQHCQVMIRTFEFMLSQPTIQDRVSILKLYLNAIQHSSHPLFIY